jgi:hypothetical protein
MEKKRRAAPGCGVLGKGSPEGCWIHSRPHTGPGCMGRRQTSDSPGTMGRDPASSRGYCEENGSNKMSNRGGPERALILVQHWRWLEANGYKQQAASCKRQAASLTRKNYNVIGVYRRKKYDDKIYESKRSIKNN